MFMLGHSIHACTPSLIYTHSLSNSIETRTRLLIISSPDMVRTIVSCETNIEYTKIIIVMVREVFLIILIIIFIKMPREMKLFL